MKKLICTLLTLVLILSLASAGMAAAMRDELESQSTGMTESKKVRKDPYTDDIRIAYIAHDLSTPNNQGWLEGIQRECAAWDNIHVQAFNADSSAENQVQIMSQVISDGYDAIIIQCSDGAALAGSVEEAEAEGIPVITLNLDADCVHSALVMAVDYDAGRIIAEEMAAEMNGKGNVVIIQGVPGVSRTDNLEQGFRDTIAAYADIKILDTQSASFEKETATTVMNSFLQNYSEIDGVFCINDAMAEGAALAIESAGRTGEMLVWGADGEKECLTMIEQGLVTGTIYTNSWDEGSTAAKIALLMIGSEYDASVLTSTPRVIMECVVVTSETVHTIVEADRW